MSSKIAAFLVYLLLVIGWVYVLVARRNDQLAMFHLRQSVMLVLTAIGMAVVWGIFAWIIGIVPILGPPLSIASFSLVIAMFIYLVIMWIVGMIFALQSKMQPLPIPLVGRWMDRLPI